MLRVPFSTKLEILKLVAVVGNLCCILTNMSYSFHPNDFKFKRAGVLGPILKKLSLFQLVETTINQQTVFRVNTHTHTLLRVSGRSSAGLRAAVAWGGGFSQMSVMSLPGDRPHNSVCMSMCGF